MWHHIWGAASLFPCSDPCSFCAAPTWHHWGAASMFPFTMRPMFLLCGSYVAPHLGRCLPVPLYNATHVSSLRLLCGTIFGALPLRSPLQYDPVPSVQLFFVTILGPCLSGNPCSFCAAPMWHHNWGAASLFLFTMRPMFLLCGSYVAPHWDPSSLFPFTIRPMFLLCGSTVAQHWACFPVPLYNATHVPSVRLLRGTTIGPCLPVPYVPSVRLLRGTTIGTLPRCSPLQCDPCSFFAAPTWHNIGAMPSCSSLQWWPMFLLCGSFVTPHRGPASLFLFTMRPMFVLCRSFVTPHWDPASLFLFTMRPMFLLCGSYVAPHWGPASLFLFTIRPMFLLCASYVTQQLGPCLPAPLYYATMYLLCVLCGTTIEPSCSYP